MYTFATTRDILIQTLIAATKDDRCRSVDEILEQHPDMCMFAARKVKSEKMADVIWKHVQKNNQPYAWLIFYPYLRDFTAKTRSEKYGILLLTALHACPQLWPKLTPSIWVVLSNVMNPSEEFDDMLYEFGRECQVEGFMDIFF